MRPASGGSAAGHYNDADLYYEDDDVVGEMAGGNSEHWDRGRWPGDGFGDGEQPYDYDWHEDGAWAPEGRGQYRMRPASAPYAPEHHRYYHHEHGGPPAGRRWVGPPLPSIARQQSTWDYGPAPPLQFVPRPVRRPATTVGPRALTWTNVDVVSVADDADSAHDMAYSPYSAMQGRDPPYNAYYRAWSHPLGPPEYHRYDRVLPDRQPPRDVLREDHYPPHYYDRRPKARPNGLPPPNMHGAGGQNRPPPHPQRPMSAGPGGRPTSAGSSRGKMFRVGANRVHPAPVDGDWDAQSSEGVDNGHYEMIREENTGLEKQIGDMPGHASRSRPPSAKSYGAEASGDHQARSRPLSAVSRPRSAVSRSNSAVGQPYSDDGLSEERESRGLQGLYNPDKAHLSGFEAHDETELGIERAKSAGESEIDYTPRMQHNEETTAATRPVGVLDMGLDANEMCQSDGTAPGTNPSSHHDNSDAKRQGMAANEPDVGMDPSRIRTPSKNVVIGGEESRVLHSTRPSPESASQSLIARPGRHNKWMKSLNAIKAIQRMQQSRRRWQGEMVYDLENEIETELESEEFDLAKFRGCNADEPYDWRRKRSEVDKVARRHVQRVVWFNMLGFFSALWQNELIYYDVHPHDLRIECLKCFTSATTVLAVVFLWKYYWACSLFNKIHQHLRKLRPLNVNVSAWTVIQNPSLWIELIIVLPHCPPFYTTSISVETMQNVCVYRAETIGAAWMLLRTYALWRFYRDEQCAQLPKRHTISNFTGAQFNSIYVFKRALDGWNGVILIGSLWAFSIVAMGYLFRISEYSACLLKFQDHPVCLTVRGLQWTSDSSGNMASAMNGFWMMFVTSTTVGYGDITVYTHLGRLSAVLMSLLGVIYAALLTASLSNALQWSASELTSLKVLEREKARQELRVLAADRIVYWWRRRKQRQNDERCGFNSFWLWWTEYKDSWNKNHNLSYIKHESNVDIESLSSEANKVDIIFSRIKYQQGGLRSIARSVKTVLLRDQGTSFGCREEIKMGFMGGEDSREDLTSADSKFKVKTGQLIVQDARRREIIAMAEKLPGGRVRRRSSIQMSDEQEKRLKEKISFIDYGNLQWYNKLSAIDDRKILRGRQASFFGMLGTLCALAQNEWLMAGGSPFDGVMFTMKAGNSVLTILTMCCILRCYYLASLYQALHLHVHHHVDKVRDVKIFSWLSDQKLWAELILVSIHNPPFYSSSFAMSDMGSQNIYVMRSETMMASFNMLRLYLLWRIIRDWMVSDLPKRCTLAGFQKLTIGSAFAVKRMLNSWHSVPYLAIAWFVILFLLSYWFRAVEVTACQLPGIPESERHVKCDTEEAKQWIVSGNSFQKVNDYYFYNAFWFMIITSTSVGYGDITPTTSLGRLIAAFAALTGLVFTSLFTASLSNTLNFTATESTANVIVSREIARLRRRELAAFVIQVWWHRVRAKIDPTKAKKQDKNINLMHLAVELKTLTLEASQEIDDASGFSAKIENSWRLLRKTDDVLIDAGKVLWYDEFLGLGVHVRNDPKNSLQLPKPSKGKARGKTNKKIN